MPWKVCAGLGSPRGVNKYINMAKWHDNCGFDMSSSKTGYGDKLSPKRFWKNLCNHAGRLKHLTCFAKGACWEF
jgi:hypothetical protein